ncbi:rho guanine nucleotide exchange factor 17 [Pelomyxa schiedti]|nr:rho guanine nucleotide exchange factor 17 [Pelomyxa schiedti]
MTIVAVELHSNNAPDSNGMSGGISEAVPLTLATFPIPRTSLEEEEAPPPPPPPRHHRKGHRSVKTHQAPPQDLQNSPPVVETTSQENGVNTQPYSNVTISPKMEELYGILVSGDANSQLEVLRSFIDCEENKELSAIFIIKGIQPLLAIMTCGQPIPQELALTILSQLIMEPENSRLIILSPVIDTLCASLSMTAHQSLIERNLQLLVKLSEMWDESHAEAWCSGLPTLITSMRNAPVMHPDTLKLSLSLFLSLLQPSHSAIHKNFCIESGVPVFLDLLKLDPNTITSALRILTSLTKVEEFTLKPLICETLIVSGVLGTISDVIVKHNQEEAVTEMVLELLMQIVNLGGQIDNEMLAINLVSIPWSKLPAQQINLAQQIYTDIASNPSMLKSISFSGIIPVICQLPSTVAKKDHEFMASWIKLMTTIARDEQLRFEIRINSIEPQIKEIDSCCPPHLADDLKQCKSAIFLPLRKELVESLTKDYVELGDSNDQIIDLVMEDQLHPQPSDGTTIWKSFQTPTVPHNPTEARIRSISKSRASLMAEASTQNNKRKCVISELWTTEKQYIKSLETCLLCFYEPLKRGDYGCSPDDLLHLFITLPALAEEGKLFLDSLSERMETYDNATLVGDVFIRYFSKSPLARLYSEYIVWHDKATAVFHNLQKLPAFTAWMRQMGTSEATNHMILPSYMIMPVQRLPRYLLLLNSLLEVTPPSHIDRENIAKALRIIRDLADTINTRKKEIEAYQKMEALSEKLQDAPVEFDGVVIPGRSFVHEGPLTYLKKNKFLHDGSSLEPCYMFLFSDILLWTIKIKNHYKFIRVLPLESVKVFEMSSNEINSGRFSDTMLRLLWSNKDTFEEQEAILSAPNDIEKESWLKLFRDAVNAHKRQSLRQNMGAPSQSATPHPQPPPQQPQHQPQQPAVNIPIPIPIPIPTPIPAQPQPNPQVQITPASSTTPPTQRHRHHPPPQPPPPPPAKWTAASKPTLIPAAVPDAAKAL